MTNRLDNAAFDLPSGAKVWCSSHPVLAHKLTKLREAKTDANSFRHILREVTFYLGYEASQDLETTPKQIVTPVNKHEGQELATAVTLIPILRAGLGMVEPMLELLPHAIVHHIGMYRNKNSLLPVQYYNKLPKTCDCEVAFILEPVIATAGTILATVSILKTWGVKKIKILSTIASKDGLKELLTMHPQVDVYLAAIDPDLTEDGYISPGLGDAGDRQFSSHGYQKQASTNNHKKMKH